MTYRELLKIAPFRRLYLGQTISQLGDALYYLVFIFMTDKLTGGNSAIVGLSGVAQTLPFLLFSLPAGVLADRLDRKNIMLFADLASGAILLAFGAMVWFDSTPPVWTLIVTGALLSSVNVLFAPAKSASIPSLVPSEALNTANGLSMATQSMMPLIGMGLSGTALAAIYAWSPQYFFLASIVLNALSFLISAGYIAMLPSLRPQSDDGDAHALAKAFQDMKDGLAYVRTQHVLLVYFLLNAVMMFVFAPWMVVYVKINRDWFGGNYGTLALCEAAFFLGMVIGGFWVGKAEIQKPGRAFILGAALVGVTVVLMAYSRNVWLFALWNIPCGICLPFAEIPVTTYIQRVVPDRFLGRVNSLSTMTVMGIQPIGIGLGGWLLSIVGAFWMILGMGGIVAMTSLMGFLDRPFREAVTPPAPETTSNELAQTPA